MYYCAQRYLCGVPRGDAEPCSDTEALGRTCHSAVEGAVGLRVAGPTILSFLLAPRKLWVIDSSDF